MVDNKKKKINYCSPKKLSPGKVSNNINKIFNNYNNINDLILFLFEHFFITSKISCPSSTLKGKVLTLTQKIIFFSISLQINSLSQKGLVFGLLFFASEPVPAFVTQNKCLHLELSRTAHYLKLILCRGRATHQMTKYTN